MKDAGTGGEHGVPMAVDICGEDGGQSVQTQDHAVRSYQPVEQAGDNEEGKHEP